MPTIDPEVPMDYKINWINALRGLFAAIRYPVEAPPLCHLELGWIAMS